MATRWASSRGVASTLLALCFFLVAVSNVSATQWTVTSYYVLEVTTSVDTLYGDYTETYTGLLPLKEGATPVTTGALSTSTYTYSYQSLEVVEIYLPADAVETSDLQPSSTFDEFNYSSTDEDSTYTEYYQPVEYTAPASCPTPFTFVTNTPLDVPDAVTDQLSIGSLETTVHTYYAGGSYVEVSAFLASTLTPGKSNLSTDAIYTYYISDCINPTGGFYGNGNSYSDTASTYTRTDSGGNSRSGSDSSDDSEFGGCSTISLSACSPLKTWIIIIVVVLVVIFLLGFVESFFWFRRLMIGQAALRLGTVCWIFLSWPMLFATRHSPGRSTEDRAPLKEQWKEMKFGKKMGLWMKWGFRHRYPVELLGVHPGYNNPKPTVVQTQQGPPGGPPGGPPWAPQPGENYVYYAPGPKVEGQPTQEGTWHPVPYPPDGTVPANAAIALAREGQPLAMTHPQPPPQVYVQPPHSGTDATPATNLTREVSPEEVNDETPAPVSTDEKHRYM
ncbi:hypothetical protein G7046_g8529 [Stylonectria norvegica]|nr:hypothetical protein G7046_g8529 [Stylonectria norvegica]